MNTTTHRNGMALALFILAFMGLVMLAWTSTTWAAPNAQGTVPTPPKPTVRPTVPLTAQPTAQPTSADDGGGGQNNGGGSSPTVQPTAIVVPGPESVCAIGEDGAQCSATDLVVVIAAGAAPAGSALTIEGPIAQPPCPASPGGMTFLNRCYRFKWVGADAQPLSALNGPVQYCFAYGPEQLALTNSQPEKMLVSFADASGAWSVVIPTPDPAGARTCATTNQLAVWSALFVPDAVLPLLPTTGGANAAGWMIPRVHSGK
ncbi:MAG: hypothetical protein HY741_04335 [Chloroflexi bacterium]|nr:hypothetical protein [Chloroflexota bacterium]